MSQLELTLRYSLFYLGMLAGTNESKELSYGYLKMCEILFNRPE
jgi:hypothetical protein